LRSPFALLAVSNGSQEEIEMAVASILRALLALTILSLGGCAPLQLRPGPEAQLVTEVPLAAADQQAGVRVMVQAEAWRGNPEHLDRKLTPFKVTIENGSGDPLRICYEDFILETGRSIRYLPLPPLDIRGEVIEQADMPIYVPRYAIVPHFTHRGFRVSHWYLPYYSGLMPWSSPWAINRAYYDIYYPRWSVRLPTEEMIARAIPEGVIEPGGKLSGFLYFPALDDDASRVTFMANLSTAQKDQLLATIRVPFEAG
jgi:hypothetical protein